MFSLSLISSRRHAIAFNTLLLITLGFPDFIFAASAPQTAPAAATSTQPPASPTPAPAPQTAAAAPAQNVPMTADQIAELKAKIAADGISYDEAPGKITITLDLNKTIPAIPNMEKAEVIPMLSPTVISKMPVSISVIAVGVAFTMELLHQTYKTNDAANQIHVETSVIPTGSTTPQPCFSFDYNRDMLTKIDLNTLAPQPFIKTVPNFTYSKWCKDALDKESKAMT